MRQFKVEYHAHSLCNWLAQLGFSFQKASFVSEHWDAAARSPWLTQTWPQILCGAKQRNALLLFGDEVCFAQWGSLSDTWGRKGQQPSVKTSGLRQAYKVFGLIDSFSGRFFWPGASSVSRLKATLPF